MQLPYFFPLLAYITLTACNQQPSTSNAKLNPNNNATSTMSATATSNTISNANNSAIHYTMPEESQPHEGTWLQWPHHHQYGVTYRNRLDQTWVDMTKALVDSEKVHLIAYDDTEKQRIIGLLTKAHVPLDNIEFNIYKTDDVWVRDNGPIFVHDNNNQLVIENWGFNGWGDKAEFKNCNAIPKSIAQQQNRPIVDLDNVLINEGGSVEIDGNGTLMATKSAILNKNRNPNLTQADVEKIFTENLGVTHFIWLQGQAGREITDQHIDGFARFGNDHTIVTMDEDDLLDFDVLPSDITTLYNAKNKDGKAYDFFKLPLTKNNVVTTYGKNLGYKGSYINYYIANTKILLPIYNDPNDKVAMQKLQTLYPNKTIVGIDVRNLYANGGMVHCVTQQQPKG